MPLAESERTVKRECAMTFIRARRLFLSLCPGKELQRVSDEYVMKAKHYRRTIAAYGAEQKKIQKQQTMGFQSGGNAARLFLKSLI